MNFNEFESKIKKMIKTEVQNYKKMVSLIPEDESVSGYLPVIDKTVNNIEHIVDVYISVKLMKAIGIAVELKQEDDGALYYCLPFGEQVKKGNGKDVMYE